QRLFRWRPATTNLPAMFRRGIRIKAVPLRATFINVGNNNENVNINLGRHDPGNSVASAATINPVYNNPNTVGSRVVDTTAGARVQPYVPVGEQPVPTADRNRAYRDLGTASDRVTSGTVTQ
ncbi:MAG TPA: hypothetical protein PK988_05315, partial [Candidatus Sumerlaeota bacterium]|nr:hypothetical protein [Candidatus Sumerlaeota bacterium]